MYIYVYHISCLTGSHRGRAPEHSGRRPGAGLVRDGVNAWHGRGGEADRRHRLLQQRDGRGTLLPKLTLLTLSFVSN